MESLGIDAGALVWYMVNSALLVAWIALAVLALGRLGGLRAGQPVLLSWSLLILFVPLMGALAYLLTHPKQRQ